MIACAWTVPTNQPAMIAWTLLQGHAQNLHGLVTDIVMMITISPVVIGMLATVAVPQTTTTTAVVANAWIVHSVLLSARTRTVPVALAVIKVTVTVTITTTTAVVTGTAVIAAAAATTTTTAAIANASIRSMPALAVMRRVGMHHGLVTDIATMITTTVAVTGTKVIVVVRQGSRNSTTTALCVSVGIRTTKTPAAVVPVATPRGQVTVIAMTTIISAVATGTTVTAAEPRTTTTTAVTVFV